MVQSSPANDAGQTDVPSTLTNAANVAAAGRRNVALLADGTLVGWGEGASVVAGFTNIVSVALGARHGLGLTAHGTVVTWGENSEGQLDVPAGTSNVVAIAAGLSHSLALIGPVPPVENRCLAPALGGNQFSLTIPTMERHGYWLEFNDTLAGTDWTRLSGVRGYGYGVPRRLTDPGPLGAQRFYRVTRTE